MRVRTILLLACLAATGCAGKPEAGVAVDGGAGGGGDYSRCSNDGQCVPGACVVGTCVARATNLPLPLAVEISPAVIGPRATLTEKTNVQTTGDWQPLRTSESTTMTVTFDVMAPAVPPSSGSAILEVPSLIPGRPALTFESPIMAGTKTYDAMIPAMLGGRPGTLKVIPLPPADLTIPPYQFAVSDTGQPITVKFPPDNRTPHGGLVDALNVAKTGYTARAFLDGTLVSNIAALKTDGTFGLVIASAVTEELSVELAPMSSTDPWFTYSRMALTGSNQNLGTVILPTYQVPQPVMFMVRTKDTSGPIAGAALRAITILNAAASTPPPPGTTRFWQSATTGANGNVNLSLIPGVNQTPRVYDVTVVPPPGSPYASTCVQQQPILGGGDTATIVLPLRPVVSGTVLSALETPVSGVTVTASRISGIAKVCPASSPNSATGPTAFSTTTDASGVYRLPVDLGTYQLDFDPASGSAAPRLSRYNFVVDADKPHVVVQLPQPTLIEGDVVDANQMPLANATIRFFEPLCEKPDGCTLPPILRAETQSDKVGHFRAIVALPSSN